MSNSNDSTPPGPPPDTIGSAPRFRRNGTFSSCEPCRKAKLRCDHNEPCARCSRRGKAAQCIYHPAPMARKPEAHSPPTPEGIRSGGIRTSKQPARPILPSGAQSESLQAYSPANFEAGTPLGYPRNGPERVSLGYMGSTGHSAILLEHKAHIGTDAYTDEADSEVNDVWHLEDLNGSVAEHKGIKFAVAILAWLPERSTSEKVLEHYLNQTFSITVHAPSVKIFHDSFWQTYGPLLEEPRKPENVALVARDLCRNTQKPLPIPRSNKEWLESFTGTRSRWDMIGLLFVAFGCYVSMNPENETLVSALLPTGMSPRNYTLSMLEAADAALMLCDELDISTNVLVVTLLYRCVSLQSIVGGDQNFRLWKRFGTLMNMLTAFGLHRDTFGSLLDQHQDQPFSVLFVEQHRRAFSSVYCLSSLLSTFTGRPSALNWRFVTQKLPIDASEHDLMIDDLGPLIDSLDDDGWNTKGKIYPATLSRALLLLNLLRDEILELSLGRQQDNMSYRVHDVRRRLESTYARFPPQLRIPLTRQTFDTCTPWDLSATTVIQLHRLHSSFLLERIEHADKDEQRYLNTAKDMLSIVISFWIERDKYSQHKDDVEWNISCYGIPSASALAIDLWNQSQAAQGRINPLALFRSDIIQQLSLFVGCLDWVGPSYGNYALCQRARKMIKHILDRILTPERSTPEASFRESSGFDLQNISVNDIPAFGLEIEDWFDSSDWTRIPMMDFN